MTTTLAAATMPPSDLPLDLPAWLYRSEAFAEDLLPTDAEPARGSPAAAAVAAALGATAGAALLALWPMAGLVA